MLNTIYLEKPLSAPCNKQLDVLGPEYEEISRYIARADYISAASVVERLFQQGVFDVRLLGYFLFGVFTERRIAGLPVILECLTLTLTQSLPFLGPAEKKELQLDSALRWLLGKVVQHVEHYKRDKDPRYAQWQLPEYAGVREVALRSLQDLADVLQTILPQGRSVQMLRHVRSLLLGLCIDSSEASPFPVSAAAVLREREEQLIQIENGSMPSGTQSEALEDEELSDAPEMSHDEAEAAGESIEVSTSLTDSEIGSNSLSASSHGRTEGEQTGSSVSVRVLGSMASQSSTSSLLSAEVDSELITGHERKASSDLSQYPMKEPGEREGEGATLVLPLTPVLKQFLEKISACERLCIGGRFDAAALVVTDLRSALASPFLRQAFPTLFGGYFRCLIRYGAELQQALSEAASDTRAASLAQLALHELYQTDFELFLKIVEQGKS
jgi:hypothetical protein